MADKKLQRHYSIAFVLVVLVMGFSYFYRGPVTGFVALTEEPGSIFYTPSIEPEKLPPQPACADPNTCGTPCWLAGNFEASEGRIGSLTCNANQCIPIDQYISGGFCCRHSDCPQDRPVCSSEGKCVSIT